jgi:hypothetical protein
MHQETRWTDASQNWLTVGLELAAAPVLAPSSFALPCIQNHHVYRSNCSMVMEKYAPEL